MNIIKRYVGFILVLAIALTSLNIVSYASETVEETTEEPVEESAKPVSLADATPAQLLEESFLAQHQQFEDIEDIDDISDEED